MRVISGKNKGRKIIPPTDKNTRPLRDMVKESIFNLIEHSSKFNISISNENILDLFAGSGSFGLECHSRGAKNVTFIETYEKVLKVLKENIANLDSNNSCKIIERDCFDYFKLSTQIYDKFEIIFIDAPYRENKINLLIDKIIEKKLLNNNGILIIHRHKKDNVNITKKLNILDTRNYGISKIIIGNY